jgi:hypothetical protein
MLNIYGYVALIFKYTYVYIYIYIYIYYVYMTHLTIFSFATDNQQNWWLMTIWTWQLVIASQRYRGPTNVRWFPARNQVMIRWGCLSWNKVFTICSTTRGPSSYVRTPTNYGYILLYVLFKPHIYYLLTKQPSSTRNGNPHLVRVFFVMTDGELGPLLVAGVGEIQTVKMGDSHR